MPETRYAKNGDVHIAYQAFGQGDRTVVLIPPIISNIEVIWEVPRARRFLEHLGATSRVLQYDKRGQGMSDRDTGVPTIDERVGDLAAVLDAAGETSAVLAGVSEGGSTAALFAATRPERVEKLILWGVQVRILRAPDFPWPVEDELVDSFFEVWAERWGTPRTLTLPYAMPSLQDEDGIVALVNRYERQSTSPGGLLAASQWIRQIDIRPVLPSIRCPTLILHRADDRLAGVWNGRLAAELIPGARYLELDGADHLPWAGAQEAALEAIGEFLTGSPRAAGTPDRVLATVLFTDIVGSTERAAALGDRAWRDLLDRHDAISGEEVAFHSGRVVKSTGDGLLATFDGPARGLQCARALQDALGAVGIPIRVGVHTGEIELRGDDVGGIAVHIAARVEAKAGPGEVLTTRTVKDLVAGSGVSFESRGTHDLKGVPDEWQLYAVVGG
jgi:class 3 adenylate cyclase